MCETRLENINYKDDKKGHAEILIWGSKFAGGNGVRDQINAKLKGVNIGHVAIRLTIPMDNVGHAEKLIQQYCYEENSIVLPHTKKKLPNGETVFEVYISAWSNHEVSLDRDFIADAMDERKGVRSNWNPKCIDKFNPEKRSYKGLQTRTTMYLGPEEFIHQRSNLSNEQYQEQITISKYKFYIREINDYQLLKTKLTELTSIKNPKLGKTECLLLDRLLPDWHSNVSKISKVSKTKLSDLILQVDNAREYFISNQNLVSIDDIQQIAQKELLNIQGSITNDFKKWKRITPKTAEKIIDNRRLMGLNNVNTIAQVIHSDEIAEDIFKKINTIIMVDVDQNNLKEHYEHYQPKNENVLEMSFSYGLNPDHIVNIPLDSLTEPANDGSLNVAPMLKMAKKIATSHEKFSYTGTNCSKVAGRVLLAGAEGNKEGKVFDRKALRKYATPQMVFNNSLTYLKKISNKKTKNHHQDIPFQLNNSSSKIQNQKNIILLELKEISMTEIDNGLSPKEQCMVLLDKFELSIKSDDDLPYLEPSVKLHVEAIIKGDESLEKRFVELCEKAAIKVKNTSNQHLKKNEWDLVNHLVKDMNESQKINKKDKFNLSYSYLALNMKNRTIPYRMSRNILGKGAEGIVKVIKNEQGERLAVKVMADRQSLDHEIALMKETGSAKTAFIRKREEKYSKSMGVNIGNKRYIICPLYKGSEIRQIVKQRVLSDKQKIELAIKCCESIKRLHDKRILHRDIKGTNFIAYINDAKNNVERAKIIDFGGAIKADKHGTITAKPFGSPGYMAPELGRKDILEVGSEWQKQLQIAKYHGSLITEANDYIDMLKMEKKKLKGELFCSEERMFQPLPEKTILFKKDNREQINTLLSSYNGENQDDLISKILLLSSKESYHSMIKSEVENYFSTCDQLILIKNCIKFYKNENVNNQEIVDIAKFDAKIQKCKLDNAFKKERPNSFSSDIYALGIMFQKEIGMKLSDLGLADMLNDDPKNRLRLNDIISILNNELKHHQSRKIQGHKRAVTQTSPTKVIKKPALNRPFHYEKSTNKQTQITLLPAPRSEETQENVQETAKNVEIEKIKRRSSF